VECPQDSIRLEVLVSFLNDLHIFTYLPSVMTNGMTDISRDSIVDCYCLCQRYAVPSTRVRRRKKLELGFLYGLWIDSNSKSGN